MFDLADSWVWDYWFADDGEQYHLFFLFASRALHDPEARHYRASIGHAVSTDLNSWTRVADALVRSDPPAFDDLATWTGSVVRHLDGTWFLFYTGATLALDGRNVQSIGYATSSDLMTWTKAPGPVLRADGQWYETLATGSWHDEAFRDPWVFADPAGDGWHMLITARSTQGPELGRGVIAHAWSPDLRRWQLREPLSQPSERGFGQLEVLQAEVVDGRPVILFSCLAAHSTQARQHDRGGVWAVNPDSRLGPVDIDAAYRLTGDSLYVGRLLRTREGQWVMFAFRNRDDQGRFLGGIIDPIPVAWQDGRLTAVPGETSH